MKVWNQAKLHYCWWLKSRLANHRTWDVSMKPCFFYGRNYITTILTGKWIPDFWLPSNSYRKAGTPKNRRFGQLFEAWFLYGSLAWIVTLCSAYALLPSWSPRFHYDGEAFQRLRFKRSWKDVFWISSQDAWRTQLMIKTQDWGEKVFIAGWWLQLKYLFMFTQKIGEDSHFDFDLYFALFCKWVETTS